MMVAPMIRRRDQPASATRLALVAVLLATVLAGCAPEPPTVRSPPPSRGIGITAAQQREAAGGAEDNALADADPQPVSSGRRPARASLLDSVEKPATGAAPPASVPSAEEPAPVVGATAEAPVLTPEPTATEIPVVSSAAPVAPPAPQAFAMSLYAEGDFVPQYTIEWCVGASIQMALNMVRPENDSSQAFQQTLWEMARDRSTNPMRGANPVGWTAVLNEVGIGPYQLVSVQDFDQAVRLAATAMRMTNRPVGLVVWSARHAWVVSGFESIGDPVLHPDFTVTGVRVLDPLYPQGSVIWGPSPEPNRLMTPSELATHFHFREATRSYIGVPPGWLLILPTSG